jgi:hypothetical protein
VLVDVGVDVVAEGLINRYIVVKESAVVVKGEMVKR